MPADCRSFKARWIFPVDKEPIENGTIEIEDGRIVAVHSAYHPTAEDLGNVAIIPGLVNAHTHLEFSDLPEPLQPAQPFSDWIRSLVKYRRERTGQPPIPQGVRECRLNGTTTLGEISTEDMPDDGFPAHGLRVVLFRELLGRFPEHIDDQLAIARRHLTGGSGGSGVIRGLSPHAPYSVHPELFRQLIILADEFHAPLAVHLAETKAELELLSRGTGELVEMLKGFDVWRDGVLPLDLRPLDTLSMLENLDHVLIVHGNYLSDEEIEYLADHPNQTVVYCPRTHSYFDHEKHPWRELLNRNVNVAIGTDSRASNPDLSVWNELLFLHHRCPEVSPGALLELGTRNGACALGLEEETGSLTVGKAADLAVVSLENSGSGKNPYSLLFDKRTRITKTMPEIR